MPAPLEDRVANLEALVAVLTMQQAETRAKTGSPIDLVALDANVARNHDAVIEEIGSLRAEINDRFADIGWKLDRILTALGDAGQAEVDR
ncbi:hypothetical protein [Nocardia vinacea]|uniref:hypothetical protein n=1 Tax=Nocardia vinacea TaxID=96468 RepID=UPI0002E04319|nr:hypothetical protein [Nocardia vinacea]